jgi:hypothetical protein
MSTAATDRVLVAPSRAEVADALSAAAAAVNHRKHVGRLPWPPDNLDAFLASFSAEAEGVRQWDAPGRPRERSAAAVAWWHDYAGRLHVRVVGDRGPPRRLFGPAPGLAHVYPERVLLRCRDGKPETVLAACACGVAGEANTLGWMGGCCGPCHDRRAAGQPPTPGPLFAGGLLDVAVAPGGAFLAALAGDVALSVWRPGEGRLVAGPHAVEDEGTDGLAASADGRVVGVVQFDEDDFLGVRAYDMARGRLLAELGVLTHHVALAPDGSAVYGLMHGAPASCRLPGGGWRVFDGVADSVALALRADGERLASVGRLGPSATLYDPATGRVLVRFDLPRQARTAPVFSPDGRLFVGVSTGGRDDALYEPEAGRTVATLPCPANEFVGDLAFAPDGRTILASGGPTLRVWGLAARGPLLAEGREHSRGGWLADGRLLTFSRRDGAVKVWPAELLRDG